MPATLVQSKTGQVDGGTSLTAVFDSALTEGNLMVAYVFTRAGSLTNPADWTTAVEVPTGDVLRIAWKIVGAAESETITFTMASDQAVIRVQEWAPPTGYTWEAADVQDVTASATATTATTHTTGTTAESTQAVALACCAISYRVLTTNHAWTNSFTVQFHEMDTVNDTGILTGYKTLSAVATQESTGSQTESTSSRACITVFNPTSAGATGTIAATMTKATALLTGVMQPKGTIASELQQPTASLTGSMPMTGVLAATLTKALMNATGAMQPSGILAATLQKALFNATGAQVYTGILAAQMQAALMNASGTHTPATTGVLAATLQLLIFAATGTWVPFVPAVSVGHPIDGTRMSQRAGAYRLDFGDTRLSTRPSHRLDTEHTRLPTHTTRRL